MGYMSMFKDYRNTLMKALCSSKDIVNLLKNTPSHGSPGK